MRAATGAASCSAYGHRVIARYGLRLGLGLLDRRLALCGHVHRRQQVPLHPRVRAQQGHCDLPCDAPHLHCDLPCDGDTACDCAADSLDFCNWPCDGGRRRRSSVSKDRRQLDAAAERVKRRRGKLRQDERAPPA